MPRTLRPALPATAVILLALAAPAAHAQANRVFASARSGNDLNTCSNIATPCQTLQGAVNQVAAGGAVLVLDTGGYGPISIGKAVSIEAPAGIEAFIHPPSGTAVTITAGASDVVVLRGLILSVGSSYGIDFISGLALHVERCVIQGFTAGIIASRSSGNTELDLYVEDTIVRSCGDGILAGALNGTVRATVDGCTLEGNGSFGLRSATDFCSSCVTQAVVHDTVAAGNNVGFDAASYGAGRVADLTIDACTAANNSVAGISADSSTGGSSTVRYSTSTVTGNGGPGASNWVGVRQFDPAQCLSRLDSTVEGNHADFYGTIGSYAPR